EVISRSFPIKIERRMSLSQIRFMRGECRCTDEEIRQLYQHDDPLLFEGDTTISLGEIVLREGLYLRVDLGGLSGTNWVGYRARNNRRLIDLARVGYYNLLDYRSE